MLPGPDPREPNRSESRARAENHRLLSDTDRLIRIGINECARDCGDPWRIQERQRRMTANITEPSDNHSQFAEIVAKLAIDKQQQSTDQQQRKIDQQVESGHCDVIPLPKCISKPFRADIYTESVPMFVANSFKGQSREIVREHKHPETGEKIVDRLLVGKSNIDSDRERGVLKQVHQDALYQLLRLWGEAEEPYEVITKNGKTWGVLELSAYELVFALRGKIGNNTAINYRAVRELLDDLTGIPITRELHYTWRNEYDEAKFTLLDGVDWQSKSIDKSTGRPKPGGEESKVTILFSRFLTKQFLEHNVKQLLLTPYMQLARTKGRRAELAPLLYSRLDRELSTKPKFNIKLAALFHELGFTVYRYKSDRKKKAQPAVDALNGLPILGERYTMAVKLRVSSDKKDFVLVATRINA